MCRSWKKRLAAAAGGATVWVRPLLDLYSIPGYIADGQSWPIIWRTVSTRMMPLDWVLLTIGVPCFLYALWPRRQSSSTSEPVAETDPPSSPPVVPRPRVFTTVDPEESLASQYGPQGLLVQVFVTIENGLDVEVRLSKLELEVEMKTGPLNCRFAHFQRCLRKGMDPNIATHMIEQVDEISVSPRQLVDGWVCFQYLDGIRIADFRRFVFRIKAIGELEQEFRLEPYDWPQATNHHSRLVQEAN